MTIITQLKKAGYTGRQLRIKLKQRMYKKIPMDEHWCVSYKEWLCNKERPWSRVL